ncbi:pyuvate ferredoxin oxidoreductase subunit delta [archaeon BMS3Abin16]|nr:pyuvate ferredoxin oxidoreductase subunit delta [archaeon BMS3Abin16]GBE56707.1 pyuvate ferredoxin oxidoreductase subunit delta [archaeon BMS3Bbin16]HDY74585.1 4Fe-4S dicluster domain-containing protein [Euryarchaeota archaeon]
MVARIIESKCKICDDCLALEACPSTAIYRLDGDEPPVVDVKYCHDCGECIDACPNKAIVLTA